MLAFILTLVFVSSCPEGKSDLGVQSVSCKVRRARNFEMHAGYDEKTNIVSLCGVNRKGVGWLAFGPGLGMFAKPAPRKIIVSDEVLGSNTKVIEVATSPVDVESFGATKVVASTSNGERQLCYSFPANQLEGSLNAATIMWAIHDKDPLGTGTKHLSAKVPGAGTLVIDFTNLKADEGAGSGSKDGCGKSVLENKEDGIKCLAKETSSYALHYGIEEEDIKVCCANKVDDGWIACGPGDGMNTKGTAVAGWGQNEVKAVSLSSSDISFKSGNFHTDGISTVEDGKRRVCFKLNREQMIGKSFDMAPFVIAIGEGNVKSGNKHGSGRGIVHVGGGGVGGAGGKKALPYKRFFLFVHVVTMMFAFLFLYPVGVLVAVSAAPGFRLGAKWFMAHRIFMMLAIGFSVLGLGAIIYRVQRPTFGHHLHGSAGYIVIGACLLQPVNAYFRVGKDHPKRRIWEYLHKTAGRLAVLGGIVVCILGGLLFAKFENDNNIPFIISCVVVGIFVIAFIHLRLRQYYVMRMDRAGMKPEKKPILADSQKTPTRPSDPAKVNVVKVKVKKQGDLNVQNDKLKMQPNMQHIGGPSQRQGVATRRPDKTKKLS